MIVLIGLDDTDNLESRGTGRLARALAAELERDYTVLGVTRHQLLVDPRVPYTSHNSSAAVALQAPEGTDLPGLFERVKAFMLADFQPGSDPGLCLAAQDAGDLPPSGAPSGIPDEVIAFGRRAQRELVSQDEARALAARCGLLLEGLGGSQDGVIGSLAAVGLAASGQDGRYLLLGRIRELSGLQPVAAVLETGISAVRTQDGAPVEEGLVLADKLRPARRNGLPVQYVAWDKDHWTPLKLN